MKKLKAEMLKGELSDFEFNHKMKRDVINRFGKQRNAHRFQGLLPAGLSAAVLLFFSMGIYWLVESHYTEQPGDTPKVEEVPLVDTPDTPVAAEFDEGMATALLDRYKDTMNLVLENAKDQPELKFKSYSEAADIHELFNDFMVRSLIEEILKGRIEERQDGLYLISTGDFNIYRKESPFTLEKITETDYRFIQTQNFEDGRVVEFSASFGFNSGSWKITSMESEELSAPQLEEQEAVDLLNKYNSVREAAFKDALDQPNFEFRTYKTKEEFYQLFLDFMSKDEVEPTFSIRLEEKNGSLFLVPMDSVRTFWPESPYVFEKAADGGFVLTQIQEGDMNGREKLTVTFKQVEGKWKITSIRTDADSGIWLSQRDAVDLLQEYHTNVEGIFADAVGQPEKKFKSYKSLEEINNEFKGLASEEFLNAHLSEHVTEKNDAIYLLTEEEPIKYSYQHHSNLGRINDIEYNLTQKQDDNIIYTASFKLIGGKWVIDGLDITEAD
ncbi:hypothetical protein [Bacillus sp. ISL-39]|uniref:hypothetical protein n=1 Tax=Bacillus sp. ISL-39 TaxID=2819124 RepID=UPI001BEA67FF|nr:hypothetical protein [Bacillus sp. ISL-39]MBT2639888.1 hypothetical protein [Bacillus sp. ISL-39]